MTEPRITPAHLREWSTQPGDSTLTLPSGVVLALVEAVEAAQAVRDWLSRSGYSDATYVVRDLRAALAPFTEETTDPLRAPCAREPLAPPKSTPKEEA